MEYLVEESIIRMSTQIKMEEAVMQENVSRFSLAYSSLVFSRNIINKTGTLGQIEEVSRLIYHNIPISTENEEINYFLPLLYRLYPKPIEAHINLKRWNNY